MAGFVARWLSDAFRLGLPLALALAAMQVPALAHGYAAALRAVEPANAEALGGFRGARRRLPRRP